MTYLLSFPWQHNSSSLYCFKLKPVAEIFLVLLAEQFWFFVKQELCINPYSFSVCIISCRYSCVGLWHPSLFLVLFSFLLNHHNWFLSCGIGKYTHWSWMDYLFQKTPSIWILLLSTYCFIQLFLLHSFYKVISLNILLFSLWYLTSLCLVKSHFKGVTLFVFFWIYHDSLPHE